MLMLCSTSIRRGSIDHKYIKRGSERNPWAGKLRTNHGVTKPNTVSLSRVSDIMNLWITNKPSHGNGIV